MSSKRKSSKKKNNQVSGEVLLQFALADPSNPSANPQDILQRYTALTAVSTSPDEEDDEDLACLDSREGDVDADAEEDDDEKAEDTSDETDDPSKPEVVEKRKRKLRLARLKRKTKARAYEYTGGTDVVGIVFLEINRITDLPPERNSMALHAMSIVFGVTHSSDSDTNLVRYGSLRGGFAR